MNDPLVGRYRQETHSLIKGAEARTIRTGRRNNFVGDVPMTRLHGKLVSGESMLEMDALYLFDYDGGFSDLIAQPFTTRIFVGSRERRWTPDFLMIRNTALDQVVEVKMLSWLYNKDPAKAKLARDRFDGMMAECSRLGFSFMLLTEDEIRVEPRLYNAKLAHRHYSPFRANSAIVIGLSALLAAPATLTVRDFADLITPLHPIHALGLAITLERLGHVRIDRRNRYSFQSYMTKLQAAPGGG